ncbi:drug resistance transporter, EmrB/QacA subfamily [Nocardia amikacinitolerans]|uniref:MFS transporter n=1 Tax=Nocardia amikacinitolerans TaxID=756689 RepID=UPI000A040C4A|nr:MFS transporter [Nocardia amikacinitolerans]MCP2316335.1 drug resistance transporter, EmrB/QacA subfamily [Nocardia amikacinitolerans]
MAAKVFDRRERLVLLLITVVELVVFLDTTVLNVALPAIGADLGLDEAGLGWVTNAYLLAFGGFMLLGGRAADLLGPRRVFTGGLIVFTAASALAGFAESAALLIAARALQGVGAAVLIPAQLALLTASFTAEAARNRAFGVWSAMGAAGAAIGTAVGGPLTDAFGWPSIFLVNVPVGLVALAGVRLLPPDTARADEGARRLDVPGALTGTTALLLIGYAIGALGDADTRGIAAGLLVLGLALLAVFVVVEARSPHPLMPLRLFTIRQVSGSAVVNALVGAAHVPTFALLALYLQNTQGYSPTRSGLAVLPVAAVNILASRTFIPYLMDRLGPARVLAIGLALQAVAMGWFARLPAHADYPIDVLPGAILLGIGLPAAFVGVTAPAVTSVDTADAGIAAGIVNTAQRVGSGLGVTALLLLADLITARATTSPDTAYRTGLTTAFATAAALAALGVVLTVVLLRTRGAVPGSARVGRSNGTAEGGTTADTPSSGKAVGTPAEGRANTAPGGIEHTGGR